MTRKTLTKRQQYGYARGLSLDYMNRWGVKNRHDGISFPICSPTGKIHYRKIKYIPTKTYIAKDGTEKALPFSHPKGRPGELNFLPMPDDCISVADALEDRDIIWFFAESDMKAAALAQRGFFSVTAGSVMGHRHKESGTARCLDVIDWTGRLVRICFDNDMWWNWAVQDGLFDLAQELMNRGAEVEVVLLPFPEYTSKGKPIKKGIDDLIMEQGDNAIKWLDSLKCVPVTDPMFSKWGKYHKQPRINVAASLNFNPLPASVLTKTPPPRQYVIEPWIATNQLASLTAAGGFGKGFIAMSMAVHIATGEPWCGYPTKQGRTVIISLEDSQEELERRLHDTVEVFMADSPRLKLPDHQKKKLRAQILDGVRCVSVDGKTLHLITERHGEIFDTPELGTLCQKIKPLHPLAVIVDPMSQLHGLNPNANEVGSALVRAFGYVRNECNCSVLVMTHVSKGAHDKGNRTEFAMLGAYSVATGSRSVIHGEVLDAEEAAKIFEVDEHDAENKFAIFTHAKGNYGMLASPMFLYRGPNGVWGLVDEQQFPRRNADDEFQQWLDDIDTWMAKHDRTAFSERDLTQNHFKEISKKVGTRKAVKFCESAIEKKTFRQLSDAEFEKLPADQKKGGGARFTLAKSN